MVGHYDYSGKDNTYDHDEAKHMDFSNPLFSIAKDEY